MRSLINDSPADTSVGDVGYEELSNDDVEAVDLDAELLSWLYKVAVKLHHDVWYCLYR